MTSSPEVPNFGDLQTNSKVYVCQQLLTHFNTMQLHPLQDPGPLNTRPFPHTRPTFTDQCQPHNSVPTTTHHITLQTTHFETMCPNHSHTISPPITEPCLPTYARLCVPTNTGRLVSHIKWRCVPTHSKLMFPIHKWTM